MKTVATVLQITRGLLILTPAEYDKPEGGLTGKNKRSSTPTSFSVPQIFELNESLKDHPFEKAEELAAFVKRCAESVQMELGDVFVCIEDEDVLITKEYRHPPAKEKLLPTFARVEAENVLHQEVDKYTILNFEYGQQYGKNNKSDEISASLFAMNTGMLTDIRAAFEKEKIRIAKITPPIAGMLYTCKEDVNSATRAIAVISMDFAATRLVVLHNGAPVFQQSFSSVLEDVAEMFSLEFGMSKMGAIDLIRQEGLGVCNKCKSASTRKQTMTMLDNAAGEILRNLRMVISTKRLDIDEIVLIDALAKLPNIANYCRQVGLTAPMENITRLFSGGSQPPVAAALAAEKGYDTTSFITLNGVLTMPPADANLLMGEANVLSAMADAGSSKLGNAITAGVGIIAALWIIGTLGWWAMLELQKNNDTTRLQSKKYTAAKELITREATANSRLENVQKNIELLPKIDLKSADIVTQLYEQVNNKVRNCTGFNVNNLTYVIDTSIEVQDVNAYTTLKNEINDNGYFQVSSSGQFTNQSSLKEGGTNPVQVIMATIKLSVTEKTKEEAKQKAEQENAVSEENSKADNPNVEATESSGS